MMISLVAIGIIYVLSMFSMVFDWHGLFEYLFYAMVVSASSLIGLSCVPLRRGGL